MKALFTLFCLFTIALFPAWAQNQATTPSDILCQGPHLLTSQNSICPGASAILTFDRGCWPPSYTCTWSPNQNISSTTGDQVVVTPSVTTTYYLTVVFTGGNTYNFNTTITVSGGGNCCVPSLSVNRNDICQGGTATISLGGCLPSGSYTCSWAPLHDISAVDGDQVVVNPLVSTTYYATVVYASGQTYVVSTTINVVANCCQQGIVNNVVELDNEYTYDASSPSHNDPFSQYPSGTTFHVTGSLKLLGDPAHDFSNNANDKFTMPPGTVLLMDADAEVYVGAGARLEAQGSTITATCKEMWKGLRISDTSDQLSMQAVTSAASNPIMRNRIMHSQAGIVLEDRGPEFQINSTDFLHNYNSINIDRQSDSYHTGPTVQNEIVACTFDSAPALMKAPYNQNGSNYYYTNTHVQTAGDLNDGGVNLLFRDNILSNSLFGIRAYRPSSSLTVLGTAFNNFFIAGISYNGRSSVTGNDALTLMGGSSNGQSNSCIFNFRSVTPLPATTQLNAYGSRFGGGYGTIGIEAANIRVNVSGATFRQANPISYNNNLPSSYNTPLQTGIYCSDLNASNNNFLDLAVGIVHGLSPTVSNAQSVTQNLFSGSLMGYMFTPNASSTAANPNTLLFDCNTFERVSANSVNTEPYIGFFSNSYVHLISNGSLAKNRFDGYGNSSFSAPNTAMGSGANYTVTYDTYDNYRAYLLSQNSSQIAFVQHPTPINYVNTGTDCTPTGTNGLARATSGTVKTTASDKARLEQNVPNPAQGITAIPYQVAAGTREAVLVIRRAIDGKLVSSLPLNVTAQNYELRLSGYPVGTYFYTLTVDGTPVATRRLVVE